MGIINSIKKEFEASIKHLFQIDDSLLSKVELFLNLDKAKQAFGDFGCNVALVLAKDLKKNPKQIADEILLSFKEGKFIQSDSYFVQFVKDLKFAKPGFINITLTDEAWRKVCLEIFELKDQYFFLDSDIKKLKYLIEFVSANPTGPLHLGHGRGGIIGDVLSNVLQFLGHNVTREFYINDAGKQIKKLGESLKVRCQQKLGLKTSFPEDGYAGQYLVNLADACVEEFGEDVLRKNETFFQNYAEQHLLQLIKKDLKDYRVEFDSWFSEKSLHNNGQVQAVLDELRDKNLVYSKDGALWFRATKFGDDKDRVIQKSNGELTYIVADLAYHENKFERGFDILIDVWGQDHHGYVKRLKSSLQALGFDSSKLDIILYQLVTIKNKDEVTRMSKRAGTFTTLREVIDTVGVDVARFFYLNRKAEAHLDFDLDIALKKTEENPVFYIQYAYVRTKGILEKALKITELHHFVQSLLNDNLTFDETLEASTNLGQEEFLLIKKIIFLKDTLNIIARNYQTHLLAYYVFELAHIFHNYYANNKILDPQNISVSKARLLIIVLIRHIFDLCLKLLKIDRPEKM